MRKIYSFVLIAAALLVGTSAWAQANVAHVNNITTPTKSGDYQTLNQAFDNGVGDGDSATITLLTDAEISSVILMNGGNDNSGDGKRITLDLGDHKNIIGKNSAICMFVLTKGELHITGTGTIRFENIKNDGTYTGTDPWISKNTGVCVAVMGSVNPSTTEWSHLIVDENVTLNAAYAAVQLQAENTSATYGLANNKYWTKWVDGKTSSTLTSGNITFDDIWDHCNDVTRIPSDIPDTAKKATIVYANNKYNKQRPGNATLGFGYGINVDIYGTLIGRLYGLQIKGQITATPKIPWENQDANFPHIYVHPNCTIQSADKCDAEFPWEDKKNAIYKQPTAIYASGYAIWDIQGNVTGANGVYVKMGQIVVQGDAHITSNAEDTVGAHSTKSGVSGVGNAITLQSDWEDGTMGITIKADENGGTPEISSSAIGGAAIVETNTTTDLEQQVQNITIEAGEFSGDVNGCVVISDNFDGDISVSGGTYTGSIKTLIDAMDEGEAETIIQTVVSQEGETATVVIGTINTAAGDQVVVVPENEDVAFEGVNEHSVVKLKANSSNISKTLSNDVTMKYLSLTGTGSYTTTVTIPKGKTMTVDQIVMDANGRIIVQAGGKLVVTGTNGIFADDVNNLVLEAVEGNQSIFLFNPNVKTNRHPHATVELVSKGRTVGGHTYWQRFGIPDYTGMKRTDIERVNPTAYKYIDPQDDEWKDMPLGEDMVPFIMYSMATAQATKDTYKFKCELVGNVNFKLPFEDHSWNYFANSYTGRMDIAELFDCLDAAAGRDKSAYVYQPENNWWDIVNLGNLEEGKAAQTVLDPMQAFIIKNNGVAANDSVNYRDVVWIPATTPAPAPARVMDSNLTKVVVTIMDENGKKSNVTLRQSNRFSDEYDNGYDTEILMNPNSFNVYASTEFGNMAHVATNNIVGATLTIATQDETMFTMTFSDIRGQQLAIRDRLTGTITMMNESAVYYFATSANDICERFDIIEPQQMPTDVEVVENGNEVRSSIYSVMGQYMGEDWNSLPKGIYIVNGNKVVK